MGTENTGGGKFVKLDAQNKNNKAGALNVTSNIHEALQNSGIADITEKLDKAALGFDIGSNITKDANLHDNEVVAAASINGIFGKIGGALSSFGTNIASKVSDFTSNIDIDPVRAMRKAGGYYMSHFNTLSKKEQQAQMPLPMRMFLNDVLILPEGSEKKEWNEADLHPFMKDAVARTLPERFWNDDAGGTANYSSYKGAVRSEQLGRRLNDPRWLSRYSFGHMSWNEESDGTVTFTDTFDFNDEHKQKAGHTFLSYGDDGQPLSNVQGGATKPNYYNMPVNDMSDTQKLFSAINEMKNIPLTRIKDQMRIIGYYFGSQGSSGTPVKINIDPKKDVIKHQDVNKNWWEEGAYKPPQFNYPIVAKADRFLKALGGGNAKDMYGNI